MTRRERLEVEAFRMGKALAATLPLSLLQRVCAGLAHLLVALGERRTRWARVNLRLAYPEKSDLEVRRLVRACYVHLAWNVVDFLRMQRWTADQIRARIRLEGIELLREAASEGNGVIIIVPHLGHTELGIQALALAGFDCMVVERRLPNRQLHAELRTFRMRHGVGLIDRSGALRGIRAALQKGRVVLVALDQYSGSSRRLQVPFFGLRVPASLGVAALAHRTRAPVLPCCVVRDAPDHHRGLILPRIEMPNTGRRRQDIETATGEYTSALERLIRRHPEHWMWGYRRFRRSPDLPWDPYRRPPLQAKAHRVFRLLTAFRRTG